MIKETMTPKQRILAAINLEPYDRVPVAPLLSTSFPLAHKGISLNDVYQGKARGVDGFQALLDMYDEVGGWDGLPQLAMTPALPPESPVYHFFRWYYSSLRYSGLDKHVSDDSSPQFTEKEVITPADYDEIIRVGWKKFMEDNDQRLTGKTPPPVDVRISRGKAATAEYIRQRALLEKKGGVCLCGFSGMDPQMALSLLRTLPQFSLDLYRRPEKVKAVLSLWTEEFAADYLAAAREAKEDHPYGIPGILMSCERGSGSYMSLKNFEQFVWPHIKKLVETWHAAGYITTLHFDTNWTLNMPYLLQLPKHSAIVELDGTTDIFKAKEILKDHLCIMGDVPAQLSALGTPQEMEAYCKKLIDIVGKNTGFILSTGCEQPPDTKFDNFKAMINTAKQYYPHG